MTAVTVDIDELRLLIREEVGAFVKPTVKREFYSPREVAQRFGTKCPQTVIDWILAGKITANKDEFSNRWMIPASEVEYLDGIGGKPPGKKAMPAA